MADWAFHGRSSGIPAAAVRVVAAALLAVALVLGFGPSGMAPGAALSGPAGIAAGDVAVDGLVRGAPVLSQPKGTVRTGGTGGTAETGGGGAPGLPAAGGPGVPWRTAPATAASDAVAVRPRLDGLLTCRVPTGPPAS